MRGIKNDYQAIAQQIYDEESGEPENLYDEGPTDDDSQSVGFDAEAFAAERRAAFEADESGSEVGFDTDTLNILFDSLGPEGIASLSAKDIMNALLRDDPSPEEAAFYDGLDVNAKIQLLEEIANSDGLGSIASFMPEAEDI